ncbi:MAG: two-component regulator propeller domain-containing protein [Bacteroidota bacterium]
MTFTVSGQEVLSFQNLTKKDGLSQASVFSIAQDSAGFMWFGTRDGLNKYDGFQFKVYKKNDAPNTVVANDIRTLYFDAQQKELWIGTNAGLSKYRSTTDDFLNYLHLNSDSTSISNNVIRQIFRDSKGRLWVGTSVGLNLLDEKNNHFKRYFFKSKFSKDVGSQDVKAILEDKNGQLWFGTASGLYFLSEKNNNTYTFQRIHQKIAQQLSDTHIKSLLEDRKGNFWIGTFDGGINYWDKKKATISIYQNDKNNPTSLSHNNIRSMCLDEADNLWVGTFDGLNFLEKNKKTFRRYTTSDTGTSGLSDKSIRSVFIDRRGSLWLGTYYGGINHLDDNYNRFVNFKHSPVGNSLSGNVVSSFAEDKNGNLWIGTEGDGLNFYDKKNKKFESFQFQPREANSLSGNNVKQLLLDNHQLWIGTFQAGLNLLDIKNKQFSHFRNDPRDENSLSANNVYGLLKEDHLLWILTYGGGLDILDLEKNKFYHYTHRTGDKHSLSSALARVFLKTKNQELWIGTEKGLNKVQKNDAGFPERFEIFLPKEKIYSLQEDHHNNIWVGTFTNGLFCLHPHRDTLIHYTVADGLPGNTVFGILEVSDEELWLSTNNGLSKFNPLLKTFTNYNYSNGLENSEYNFNAYFKTSSGDLLFGGINGFTQFNPEEIQPNLFVPPVAFTELRKNNQIVQVGDATHLLRKSINETESLIFEYNEANFAISFAALDFLSPENNHHAFMLEGIDKDWNYSVGKTEATYTIQREGEYVFRMKGGNSDGIWNPEERQLKIIVRPPPWRSWWAYLIYVIGLGAVIFGLVRFVRLRHRLQLETIAKQQQEELHEVKLRFFTNITHEFRTPLTLILGPLKDLMKSNNYPENVGTQLNLIQRNAHRLLNLVNQVLTFRKLDTDHEPLKIAQGNIVEFLQEIFLPFQEIANRKQINFRFDADDAIMDIWFDQDKLEKVFFNLLSNAFKFTPDGGKIVMRISQNHHHVEVQVQDNGVGVAPEYQAQIFKRFYEKSDSKHSNIKGTGIGLAISKQMVELHGGKIFVESNSETPTSSGATFIVQIPKGKAHFKDVTTVEQPTQTETIKNYQPVTSTERDLAAPTLSEEKTVTEAAPSLLIVEDNSEVRDYVQQIFANEYRITLAEDGQAGLEKAKRTLPDLIISDVMMPQMDGITFCRKLKSDFEISHIPIVLLTARTASLFKIEGLKTGADDYVTKPFHPEELRLRVRNIIQTRREAKERFARVLTFNPKEISITSADEIFLEKALRVVEKNMEHYDFKVNQFAFELAVSRPLLFTKLKALTGQTPNNFIKTIRLKRAAQLIKTKKLNISEVARKVGFKDPKYFRKCFKEQFKMSPSDFEVAHLD